MAMAIAILGTVEHTMATIVSWRDTTEDTSNTMPITHRNTLSSSQITTVLTNSSNYILPWLQVTLLRLMLLHTAIIQCQPMLTTHQCILPCTTVHLSMDRHTTMATIQQTIYNEPTCKQSHDIMGKAVV
ncbi:hypothetical protein V8B55DRAFT_1514895 [Mucor lusitanicus]